jgi:long-chain acyl-CoA synthetase
VDTAALHLGAVPFSIYNTSAPEQIEYLFSNALSAPSRRRSPRGEA